MEKKKPKKARKKKAETVLIPPEVLKDMSYREQEGEIHIMQQTRGWQILKLYRDEKINAARETLESIPDDKDFRWTQGFLYGFKSDEEIIQIIEANAENERVLERQQRERD